MMGGRVEVLSRNYERQVTLPWDDDLAGPQRVWFAVYAPDLERRLRLRFPLFENATRAAGKRWKRFDLTSLFAEWMAAHDAREDYFQSPQHLGLGIKKFEPYVAEHVRDVLTRGDVDSNTVVALSGVASLFGLASVSTLVSDVAPAIKGRLLVFFPGHTEQGLFKLLDATRGYNYLAVPITAESGG